MQLSLGKLAALAVFIAAATLEVVGDALIRKGMRGGGLALVGLGFMLLGTYGVLVNLIDLDFSKLLGAYVGVFAIVSVLTGRLVFREQVPASTWAGLAVILGGSLMVHFGGGK
jgi:drug/metabolite transporter superfamily protein YnfA